MTNHEHMHDTRKIRYEYSLLSYADALRVYIIKLIEEIVLQQHKSNTLQDDNTY